MSNLCLIRSAAKSPHGVSEQTENLPLIFDQTRDLNIRMFFFFAVGFLSRECLCRANLFKMV